MKPNGLKNKTRENHKIDGLSPDANKLRGHSEIINVETLTKNKKEPKYKKVFKFDLSGFKKLILDIIFQLLLFFYCTNSSVLK